MTEGKKLYFFGAGTVGKRWIKFALKYDIKIEGVIDNNKDLWGHYCEGILIYSADILQSLKNILVYITCVNCEAIKKQLFDIGLTKEQIIDFNSLLGRMVYLAIKNGSFVVSLDKIKFNQNNKILIDLNQGMVLGGVESWSYAMAQSWKKAGYKGIFLAGDFHKPTVINDTYATNKIQLLEVNDEKLRLDRCIESIIKHLPCIVIGNFPLYIFCAACIVKSWYPDKIKVVAVQHNDEDIYYNTYAVLQEYIDCCLVISSQIEYKLLQRGVRKEIIYHLDWEIPCDEVLEWHLKNNEILQIGYAGRITISQKRADLFIVIAKELLKKGVQFKLNIAGTGDYLETLKSQVISEKLEDYFNILGVIDRACIPDFWKRQDVMISCSEWEGHSITQAEAMAAGAVPVITDVSGAKDDVTDGKNGFIVPLGDIALLTDKITYLYHNRDKLETMGYMAHSTIYEKQKNMNQKDFWDRLFKG